MPCGPGGPETRPWEGLHPYVSGTTEVFPSTQAPVVVRAPTISATTDAVAAAQRSFFRSTPSARQLSAPCSSVLHGALGQPHPRSFDDLLRVGDLVECGAEGDGQRHEVLLARVGEARGRGLVLEVEDRVHVARDQRLPAPRV